MTIALIAFIDQTKEQNKLNSSRDQFPSSRKVLNRERGEYSGRDKNENFLSLLSFIDPAKRSGTTQVKGNATISFFHFFILVWDKH